MSKVKLRLKRRHPRGKFQLGSHSVTSTPKVYELDEAEVKELKSDGCQHWLEEVKVAEKVKKKKD